MVLLKMLMEIGPPTMRGLLVMTIDSISSSRREVSPAESLCRRAKLFLPKFRLETAALRLESPLFIFFLGQMTLCTRRWAPEVGQGAHYPPGRARGGGAPWCLVGTWVPTPVFFIYSKTILRKFSAHLEMCRIGNSNIAF